MENLKTCYDLITKHGTALQRALSELESGEDLVNKNKIVCERATLFRISSNAMINVNIIVNHIYYLLLYNINSMFIKQQRIFLIVCFFQ